jgi:hypothetical protein
MKGVLIVALTYAAVLALRPIAKAWAIRLLLNKRPQASLNEAADALR